MLEGKKPESFRLIAGLWYLPKEDLALVLKVTVEELPDVMEDFITFINDKGIHCTLKSRTFQGKDCYVIPEQVWNAILVLGRKPARRSHPN